MPKKLDIANRTALITGGAGGIGSAVAAKLAAHGTNIVLTDICQAALDRTAASMPAGQVLPITADVTDAADMQRVVNAAVERFGHLDIVFANAGIAAKHPTTVRRTDPAEFEKIIEVDLLGVYRTIYPTLEHVITNQGHILITGSIYSFMNGVANGPYAASKAAVESLGRVLRTELSPHGASAGVLSPGWVATDISELAFGGDPLISKMRAHAFRGPLGKAITPEQIADAVIPGIQARAASIVCPRRWLPIALMRGVANPAIDAVLNRDAKIRDILTELEDRPGVAPDPR